MEDAIKNIIDKTLELEGLLMLAQSRSVSGNADALHRLILAKKDEVAQLVDSTFGDVPASEPEPIDEPEDPIIEAPEEVVETVIEPIVEPEPIAMSEPVEAPFEPVEEPVETPLEPEVKPFEPVEEKSGIFDDSIDDDVQPADEEDAPLDEEYEDEEDDDDEVLDDDDDESLTLDEALQRSMSRDLRKAFSLNDRFRYRRELFGNSDVEMNDTLNLVETMHTYAEAEEFFYGDLEWDSESPEVKDFMAVIRNHFYNKEP
ncbi:MAG: hypothetical protein ACI4UN_04470 [Muribaculaceae bacterium]